MWMLVEWSEDQDIYPTYKIIRKKYVLENDCTQFGKYIRFRDKRSKKKRRAKIVMCSENRKTLKEHKKKLVRRGRKVKALMSKCMQKCRKQMIRMPAPLVERSRSRSPHGSRNSSVSRRDRRLTRHRIPMIRSRSMVCSTPKPKKPPKIVYDNTTQTDPTPTLHKPTVEMFMLFVKQIQSHFVKLLGKIEELRASRNGNGSSQQNELDSSDNSESDISDSEDLPHQDLIDILKGLNVNVQVVDAKSKRSNENTRDSNETINESNGNVQNSNVNAQRFDENDHYLDQNSLELVVNDQNHDNNDNIADENEYVADDIGYDYVVVEDDDFAVNNDHVAVENNLFADADMQEMEEVHPDENMQVFNEAVAENALNENANAQIFYENVPVQPVFAEPGQLPGYPEPMVQPVFAEPRQLPGYPEPRVLPVFAEPRQLPAYPEPGVQPVFPEPRQLPAYPEPGVQPVFEEPRQLPGNPDEEPRVQPVFAEPGQLPGYPVPMVQPVIEEPRLLPNFVQPRQPPVFAGPSRQPAPVDPRPSSPKPRKLEVRRVSAQSTIPGEPSAAAQRCVYGDEEMVAIGFHRTLVPRRLMNDINWTTYTTATRQLMQAIFPRRILATHSLSGKPSPAFPHQVAKKRLDPKLVEDIVETVRSRCGAHKQWIRGVITTKCTDEARLYRNRRNQNNRNDEDQENQDPEEGPASRERRRRRGTDESSSSSD
ncbi:uncharacterized protein isoform X2 [Choristoneura fumiferana]|uniref:uncharacterized protein isoform X2 n=1 Tax=Choristoneura fumiferana TaxID=7141 RepID=UPI003D156433